MATFTALPNRYFIFNFFEKPEDEEHFVASWNKPALYVRSKDEFVSTHLHKSTDDSARYPWVNVGVANSSDICMFGKPDEEWKKLTKITAKQLDTKITPCYPAGFQEIASYKNNKLVQDDKSSAKTSRFFITAVKLRDDVTDEQFESNWSEWSGINCLHEKLKNENLKDSLLYKRFTTNMSPAFRYTVRTEVDDVSDALGHAIAKETNQRAIQDGVETTAGFYEVDISYVGKMDA